jgi:hypothetical protein
MLAYAFLAKGAVEPLSGFAWPMPKDEHDVWVDVDTAPSEALRGYAAADLPYWVDEELWSIELAGTLAQRDHLLLAERARLLGRIDAWTDPLAWEFVAVCARRVAREAATALHEDGRADAAVQLETAKDLADLELAASAALDHPSPAGRLAGYVVDVCFYARDARVAARAAGIVAKMSAYALAGEVEAREYDRRLANERAWQAAWLVDRLGL